MELENANVQPPLLQGIYIHSLPLANRNRARPTRQQRPIREPLRTHDHVIVIPQLHADLGPCIEVLACCNRTADTLLRAQRPELRERSCPLDGRLVHPLARVDLVRAFVNGEFAFLGPGFAWRNDVVRLNDVVFDQWIPRPAVESEIAGAFGIVGAGVFECSM